MRHKISIADDVSTLSYSTNYFDKVFKGICITLKLLNVEYKCAFKPEVNPTKIPCYIRYRFSFVVRTQDEDVLKELFMLSAPRIQYSISQRRGKIRAKV
jgi:hypothetical protein